MKNYKKESYCKFQDKVKLMQARFVKIVMFFLWTIVVLLSFGCSTLSQNMESPVVLKPKDWSVGVGSAYTRNINFYEDDEQQKEEMIPAPFVASRVGLFRNVEVGLAAGTMGLTLGSAADLRLRYMWLGGWKTESQLEAQRERALNKKSNRKKKYVEEQPEEELDDEDLEGLDDPLKLLSGWVSTASVGGFWSGHSGVEDFSVGTHHIGLYFSNAFGYKSRNWLFYFGGKAVQLETDYHFKKDRLSTTYDVDSQFNKLLYGAFVGVTYSWQTRRGHVYQWDTMFSLMQLPRSPDDRSIGYFPGVTVSFWYID